MLDGEETVKSLRRVKERDSMLDGWETVEIARGSFYREALHEVFYYTEAFTHRNLTAQRL